MHLSALGEEKEKKKKKEVLADLQFLASVKKHWQQIPRCPPITMQPELPVLCQSHQIYEQQRRK
jgi:hypothetical protein